MVGRLRIYAGVAALALCILAQSDAYPVTARLQPGEQPVITPENAGQVGELAILARGSIRDAAWSADSQHFIVVAGGGIWVYDVADTAAAPAHLPNTFGPAQSVAISLKGDWMATGHEDGRIVLWALPGYISGPVLEGHNGLVSQVAFSPDGAHLASASSQDSTVRVWSTAAQQTLYVIDRHTPEPLALAFSPDSRLLATAGGNAAEFGAAPGALPANTLSSDIHLRRAQPANFTSILVWDVATGEEIVSLDDFAHAVTELEFSSDGQYLAGADLIGRVLVWDAATWQVVGSPSDPEVSYMVAALAFTPDNSRLLISTLPYDSTPAQITEWLVTGERRTTIPSLANRFRGVTLLEFSPDKRLLASASPYVIEFQNASSYSSVAYLAGHHLYMTAGSFYVRPEFSFDGTRLALYDHTARQVVIWDTAGRRQLFRFAPLQQGRVISFAFSPDGSRLATGLNGGPILIWDVETNQQIATLTSHEGAPGALNFSPDGRWLASASANLNAALPSDFTVRLWDVGAGSGALLHTFVIGAERFQVVALTFSPDSRVLGLRTSHGDLLFYDVLTRTFILPEALDFQFVGVERADRFARAFQSELYLLTPPQNAETRIRPLPERISLTEMGYLFLTVSGRRVIVLDGFTYQELFALEGHEGEILFALFSPGGRLIITATGSSFGLEHDDTIRLWDATTGDLLASFNVTESGSGLHTNGLAVSPDGRYIAAGSDDATVRLFGVVR